MRFQLNVGAVLAVVCGAALLGMPERAMGQVGTIIVSGNPSTDVLVRPVFVTWAPGDYKRIFVVEKQGRIRTIDNSQAFPLTQASASAFLNITPLVQQAGGTDPNQDERGLLGLAFHPQYQTNGKFYVYYTNPAVAGLPSPFTYYQNVVEYTVRDPSTLVVNPALDNADAASARLVMRIQHPSAGNHNGGWMGFGPDGYLYLAVGDGGNFGDQGSGHNATIGNALDTGRPLGKMLRIDIDSNGPPAQGAFWTTGGAVTVPGAANYGIPADNPVLPVVASGTSPARSEIWAYGLRNPWRSSFDKLTGDLWIGDVQQGKFEEINYQPALTAGNAAQVAGRNYGWRCFEGTVAYDCAGATAGSCPNLPCAGAYDSPGLTPPVGVYAHSMTLANTNPARLMLVAATGANFTGIAVTGGYVYRGCRISELYGQYMFTDYGTGAIFSTTLNTTTGVLNNPTQWTTAYAGSTAVVPNLAAIAVPAGNAVSFGQDAYGEVYIVSQGNGRIIKFVSTHVGTIPLANADYDRNGMLAVSDIFNFLADWFASATRADFNRDGALSVQDIFDFLSGWFGGCAG